MLLRLIRFFRGFVTFKIIGRFPERFINLALKNGIGIFGALPLNGILTASMVLSDYRNIRHIARRSGVRLRIIKRHGLPFITYRFRHRWGIAVGVALFIIISLIMQNFIWTVEIIGVSSLSETALMNSLEEAGFEVGKFKGKLDLHKIERKILLEYDKIGWMSINLIGTHAEVEIKEKTVVPKNEYSADFSNIMASRDGVILSSDIRRGTAEVSVGSAVSKGQLLVSGMYENALGELHFVDADANVVASTSYDYTATADEIVEYLKPITKSKRTSIELIWFDFPITFSPEKPPFTTILESKQVVLYDNPIPLAFHTEHIYHYELTKVKLSKEDIENMLKADFALYKLFNLKNTLSVDDTVEISKENSMYTMNAKLKCTEDIAHKENLVVNSE